MSSRQSEFRHYFDDREFVDRFVVDAGRAVDVIIPIIHTNELWRANLLSIYREIPVNRLLIADGGCKDDSLDIVRKFPRVEILDHRTFQSLGYSLRKLIEEVRTDWFIYLHSDIYLPEKWFDAMEQGRGKYDWFESGQTTTILAKFTAPTLGETRAYSGAQMGRKVAFGEVLPLIDDDFLYRNEDIILASLIQNAGHRYGKISDAFCEHQVMFKESPWERRVKHVYVVPEIGHDEEIRAAMTYVKGIVKYLPLEQSAHLVDGLQQNLARLDELGVSDEPTFAQWVADTSPAWSEIFPLSRSKPAVGPAPVSAAPVVEPAPAPIVGPLVAGATPAVASTAGLPEFLHRQLIRARYAAKLFRAEGGAGVAKLVIRRLRRRLH